MTASIVVDAGHPFGTIDDRVHGHFLESNFFGNIDGGVFDEGSSLSRTGDGDGAGLRQDVIDLCRRLRTPVVRWPGGNFTSAYHWTDGIGPRDRRPRRLDVTWGGEESNRFGTDEFLTWCELVGTEPFLVHSCRDIDEAVRWAEYTNYAGHTELTRQRSVNGHPDPRPVHLWGIGNEVYGRWQMGHRSPEQYAADAREHMHFLRMVDPSLRFVGVGMDDPAWNEALLRQAGDMLEFVSVHLYGASTHAFAVEDPADVAAQAVYFERELRVFCDLIADTSSRLGLDRPPAVALDEWNVRHLEPAQWPAPQPGADGGTAPREKVSPPGPGLEVNRYSRRTAADVLCYAGVFHAMHRLAGHDAPVRMANTVNLLNANGVIVARPGGAIPAATYAVFDLYGNHLGRTALPVTVDGPQHTRAVRQGDTRLPDGGFGTRAETVPTLDAVATRSDGGIQVAVINRDTTEAVTASLQGLPGREAQVVDLGADATDLFAGNSLSDPLRVAIRDRGRVDVTDGYRFPAHSVTVLSFGHPIG